jgi:GNAT superfamily N-acetyltransferase
LKHRLYVPGWELRGYFKDTEQWKFMNPGYMGMAFDKSDDNNTPIAVCVFVPHSDLNNTYNVGVFVRKKYRRMGIARKLIDLILKRVNKIMNIFYNTNCAADIKCRVCLFPSGKNSAKLFEDIAAKWEKKKNTPVIVEVDYSTADLSKR